jgi:hypothetical protein
MKQAFYIFLTVITAWTSQWIAYRIGVKHGKAIRQNPPPNEGNKTPTKIS